MEGSKASTSSCELPTGFCLDNVIVKDVFFRELAGPEEEILASKKIPMSRRLTQVINNCTIRIGSIEDRAKISDLTSKMLNSDRLFLLIRLRIVSLGNLFSFEQECPSCNKKDKLVYDLNEIVIIEPPKADALFKEFKTPSGSTVRIKAADAKIDEQIEKSGSEAAAVTMALFARIDSFNNLPPTLADIKNMAMKDRNVIRKEIDNLEGEIDDECNVECKYCGTSYKTTIPIGTPDFFFQ